MSRYLRKRLHLHVVSARNAIARAPCVAAVALICLLSVALAALAQFTNASRSASDGPTTASVSRFTDADLLDVAAGAAPTLVAIRNISDSPHGLFLHVGLSDGRDALAHLRADNSAAESMPSLFQLARALGVANAVASSVVIHLSLPLSPALAARPMLRRVKRALRTQLHVPVAAMSVPCVVYAGTLEVRAALRMPAVEPYEWRLAVPTADECGRPNRTAEVYARCRVVLGALVTAGVAGCDVPGIADFVGDGGADDWRLGRPCGCFRACTMAFECAAQDVVIDVWKQYVSEMCEVEHGLRGRLRRLAHIGWGVSERASGMAEWLEVVVGGDGDGKRICEESGLSFYREGG